MKLSRSSGKRRVAKVMGTGRTRSGRVTVAAMSRSRAAVVLPARPSKRRKDEASIQRATLFGRQAAARSSSLHQAFFCSVPTKEGRPKPSFLSWTECRCFPRFFKRLRDRIPCSPSLRYPVSKSALALWFSCHARQRGKEFRAGARLANHPVSHGPLHSPAQSTPTTVKRTNAKKMGRGAEAHRR
ncbi:hypothetical protein BKA81DRAFT_64875 [Phyllosticta paracitricarpa]